MQATCRPIATRARNEPTAKVSFNRANGAIVGRLICNHSLDARNEAHLLAHATSDTQSSGANRRQALSILGGSVLALTAGAAATEPAAAALKDYNVADPEAPVEEVSVQLGTKDGQLVFTPNALEFTQGRIYKLKLTNPSSQTHYFTALEFASKIFTIFLLAGDPAVEVKGAISEVELKAGASASWVFIPIKPGTYPLRCTKKGHDAMLGTITVKRAAA